jgi:hypothetical protein
MQNARRGGDVKMGKDYRRQPKHHWKASTRFLAPIVAIAFFACVAVALIPGAALAETGPGGPSINTVTPNSAENTGDVQVKVEGASFTSGCSVQLARNGSRIAATSVVVTGTQTIDCVLDLTGAAAGGWDLTVTNPSGYSSTLTAGFTVVGATGNDACEPNDTIAQSYGPLSAGVAYESYVTHEGDVDFFKVTVPSGTARLSATLSSIPYGCDFDLGVYDANGKKVGTSGNGGSNNEQVDIASPQAGQYFLQVQPWTGSSTDDSYVISYTLSFPPSISGLSPAGGVPGATVTISGSGFGAIKDGSSVTFGSVQASSYLSWSPAKVVVRVPSGVGGKVAVCVVTGSGKSNGVAFWINPRVDSLSTSKARIGSILTINGQGFGSWGGGATCVYFGKVKATAYSSWSNYTVKVKVPSVTGTVAVKVCTAGGTSGTKNLTVTK